MPKKIDRSNWYDRETLGELTGAESQHLLDQMIAGVAGARDALITGNICIAIDLVNELIEKVGISKQVRDDAIQAGIVSLIENVDGLPKRKLDTASIKTYLATAIRHAISKFIDEDRTIRIPKSSQYDAWKRGEPIEKISVESYDSVDGDEVRVREEPATEDPTKVADLRDLIHSCADTPEQLKMLELLEKNAGPAGTFISIADIAIQLGVSESTIYNWRKEIEQRYDEKTKALLNDEPMPARKKKRPTPDEPAILPFRKRDPLPACA